MKQIFYMLIERPIIWLNFMFYRFGMRHGDSDPCAYACFSSSALILINFMSIKGLLSYWLEYDISYEKSKLWILALIFLILLINYLIVYHKKKYKDYFEERTKTGVYQRDKKKFAFVFWGTLLFTFVGISYVRISAFGIENW